MSDTPPLKVPNAEDPGQPSVDAIRQEEGALDEFLEKRARSAALRDAYERQQHLGTLNKRIDKLQDKLDCREAEINQAAPRLERLAALEQAQLVAKPLVRDSGLCMEVGIARGS